MSGSTLGSIMSLAEHAGGTEKRLKVLCGHCVIEKDESITTPRETVSQSFFVIASDRRERGNLFISNALGDCFGRFTPSQ